MTDGTYQATYAYLANSAMTAQTTFYESSSLRLQTTREYDLLNRLQRVYSRTNVSAGTPLVSYFDYQYNQANQRTRSGLVNGSYWLYRYDALGQVTSGKKYWADGTPVPGQQYEYGFDDIGNRKYARSGGDSNGWNLRTANYNLNSANLNEYGNRTTPSSVDIIGLGEVGSSVTVNGSGADYRRGEYFREDLGLSTGVDPLWQSVSVTAGATTIAGHLLIPAATQSFSYDLDGNLTSDGVWTYYYDAENRLYRVENSTSLSPTSARKKLLFEYDHLGRRIRKQVYGWATSDYSTTATTDTRFFYDGWNLIKETTGSAWKSYMWGLDLSGTMEGGGGVGGLLLFDDSTLGAHFPCYDGNGNITKLVKASDSTTTADYEFDPFGQTIRMSGTASKINPFRFSSKYQDEATDLVYYGYRFYSPTLGRWVNRDTIEEDGGVGLYAFVSNQPVCRIDPYGLSDKPNWNASLTSSYPWRYERFSIILRLPCDKSEQRRIFNKIFIGLTKFDHFDPNVASVFDPVPNNLPGEKREFDTRWWPDWPYRVAVPLNNNVSSHMVTAVTLNLHPLVGIRRWGVHWLYNDQIEIYTDAWEKPGGPVRKTGMFVIGRHLQEAMWNDYLSNIGNFWNGREGVTWVMPLNGSGVIEGPVSESDGRQPNPFNFLLPKQLQSSPSQ